MTSDEWLRLNEAIWAIWDHLDDKSKSIILGYKSPETTQKSIPTGKALFSEPLIKPSFNFQANLHEMSSHDFILANMHDETCMDETTDEDKGTIDELTPVEYHVETILNNAVKSSANNFPPGDIRWVMSKLPNTTLVVYVIPLIIKDGPW
jgi:hypothetical protein